MSTSRFLTIIAVGLAVGALEGCGGGGGGGGSVVPVAYVGNTNPAVITTTNASTITTNVIGSTDASVIVGGASIETSNASGNQGTGPAHLARILGQDFRAIVVRTDLMRSAQQTVAGLQVDLPTSCDADVGTLRIFGTLDDNTLTGTVNFTFTDCLLSGITLNGSGTMQIFMFLTDFNMSFARLTVRGTGLSVDAGGSLRYQEIGNTATMTLNLDEINNNTGKMRKSVNLVIVDVFDNFVPPTSFTQTLTGQVFHSDYGFVNVATTQAFFFATLAQLFPNTGQMVLTGAPVNAGTRKIRVTALPAPPAALPATLANLELDLDGDNTYEINARLKWSELTHPIIGGDLGDNDLPAPDGMHNGWETFYGLNPNDAADAAVDSDGDTFNNLAEYTAGTDPKDISSHP